MKRPSAKIFLFALCLLASATGYIFADDAADSIDAWKKWKSIDAAIAARPLDGPEDIREKADIIADRIDELERENARQKKELEQNRQILQSLANEKEILQDLAELQQGRDTQAPMRIHDLTERFKKQEQTVRKRQESLNELQRETDRLKALLDEYRKKAGSLQKIEGGKP